MPNDRVYIHELIDIIGPNRSRYMHHMTANWCPVAREERRQLCFGVWGTVGSTGRWPEVVNLWEIEGWDGMAHDFAHELSSPGMQDPALAQWWDAAAALRRGGVDRIMVPAPWTATIDELNVAGVRGVVYAHELMRVPTGTSPDVLDLVRDEGQPAVEALGGTLVAAMRTALGDDSEVLLLWAFPSWGAWSGFEQAWESGGALAGWRATLLDAGASWRRTLLIDAPLSPLRTGRQPQTEDRRPFGEL